MRDVFWQVRTQERHALFDKDVESNSFACLLTSFLGLLMETKIKCPLNACYCNFHAFTFLFESTNAVWMFILTKMRIIKGSMSQKLFRAINNNLLELLILFYSLPMLMFTYIQRLIRWNCVGLIVTSPLRPTSRSLAAVRNTYNTFITDNISPGGLSSAESGIQGSPCK